MTVGVFSIQMELLGLWAAWFAVVLITNVLDGLHAMAVLPQDWAFRSQNYQRVRDAVDLYRAPPSFAAVLFVCVMFWQAAVACMLWYALIVSANAGQVQLAAANVAFLGALGMWTAFILAEEIFKQYRTETKHLLFFSAQLLSWGALQLLSG